MGWIYAILEYLNSPAGRTLIAYIGVVSVVFMGLQIMAAVMVYAERKVAAFMQQRVGPLRVGPQVLLQPVAAAFFAWVLLGETLGWLQVAGAVLVLAGIRIAHQAAGSK